MITITKKVAKPLSVAVATVRSRQLAVWRVFSPAADDVLAAIGLHRQAKLGFWDATIVLAAADGDVDARITAGT